MNQKDTAQLMAALETAIQPLAEATRANAAAVATLCREQRETNELLRKLVSTNTSFISTLTSFLREDHKARMERELRESEQAKQREPLPADLLY